MKGYWGVLSVKKTSVLGSNLRFDQVKNEWKGGFSDEYFSFSTLDQSNSFFFDPSQKIILSGWVRIDNFFELVAELNLDKGISDLELVFKCYLKWGKSCVQYLYGDFSFFVYDLAVNSLFLVKDQLGIKPLFYCIYQDFLIFSTHVDFIKRLLPVKPSFNLPYLVKELKNYPQSYEDTFFDSILRLKPAHYLFFDGFSLSDEIRYWDLMPVSIPHFDNDESYFDLLRTSLFEAVKSRLRGKKIVGCQLSGGMDSSAIAVILSRLIPKEHLHTYSFVLNELTSLYSDSGIDEKGTQEEVITYAGLLVENHHPITGFHFRDVFEELTTKNEVMGGLANSDAIWQDSLFKHASENQAVEVMFSGFPGDEGISCPGGNYFYEYLATFDLGGLFSHVYDFRLSGLKGILNYYRSKFHGTTKPSYAAIQRSRNLLHPDKESEFNLHDSSFAFKSSFKSWLKSQITRPHTCLRTESEGTYANRHGLETVYPLADLRLIQLVYSLPPRFFAPKPYTRALFRNVCKGVLPEQVRLQPKFNGAKTLAFADYWIKIKYQQLQEYPVVNSLGLFLSEEDFLKRNPESELMGLKRYSFLKEIDFLIEKNR